MKPIKFSPEVAELLQACGLPTDDLRDGAPAHLFGVRRDGTLAGVVGVEIYGESGLLRSLAVDPKYRGSGLGHKLVAHSEEFALRSGLQALYLLTTTAAVFFDRLGYESVPRDEAPLAIAATAEFADLCPATATFMFKALTGRIDSLVALSFHLDGVHGSQAKSSGQTPSIVPTQLRGPTPPLSTRPR